MKLTIDKVTHKVASGMKWTNVYATKQLIFLRPFFEGVPADKITDKKIVRGIVEAMLAGKPRSFIHQMLYRLRLWFKFGFDLPFPISGNIDLNAIAKAHKIPIPQSAVNAATRRVQCAEIDLSEALVLLAPPKGKYGEMVDDILAWARTKKPGKAYVLKLPRVGEGRALAKHYSSMQMAVRKACFSSGFKNFKVGFNAPKCMLIIYDKMERKEASA